MRRFGFPEELGQIATLVFDTAWVEARCRAYRQQSAELERQNAHMERLNFILGGGVIALAALVVWRHTRSK